MRWFYKWLARKLDNSFSPELKSVTGTNCRSNGSIRVSSTYDDENVIRFTLYGATGGKIVEATSYDKKNDRERVHRYVIGEDGDLSDTLAKIITMENLR